MLHAHIVRPTARLIVIVQPLEPQENLVEFMPEFFQGVAAMTHPGLLSGVISAKVLPEGG